MDFTRNDLNRTVLVRPEWLEKNRKWYEIDATDKTLGKLAVIISNLLSGKEKVHNNEAWDAGDFVVVKNAAKIRVTGNKLEQKKYFRYSGYKGNVKETKLSELLETHPERAIWFAVNGMLPKNKLRDRRMKRLKVFGGASDKFNYLHPETIS